MAQEPRRVDPLRAGDQHASRLVALIAYTAVQEVNICRAMDASVFLDGERLSVVGCSMQAAGRDATPIPSPHSLESNHLSPFWAQYNKQTSQLFQLVDFTLGVPTFSLSTWVADVIPSPHTLGRELACTT